VNRGKITSTNSTHPTSKIAKQNPLQRNARDTEPLSRSDLVHAQKAEFAKFPLLRLRKGRDRLGGFSIFFFL